MTVLQFRRRNDDAPFSLEKREYERFLRAFEKGKYGSQRLGQAFYNHFSLHKMTDQSKLHNLHAKDGAHAQALISQIFTFS